MAEPKHADPWLLIEIGLIVLLLVLAVFLYWIPAARAPFLPHWWALPVLGILFFAIVALHSGRRRRRARRELREALDDATHGGPAPRHDGPG